MRQIEVKINGKSHVYRGPSMWSEVPANMVLSLIKLVKESRKKNFLFLVIPQLLYGIPYDIMQIFTDPKRGKRFQSENDDDPETLIMLGEQILDTCRWIFTEQPPTKWLIPQLSLGTRMFYAPKDKLADMTFGEFFFTEQYIGHDAAMLCAILYRGKKWPSWSGVKNNPRKDFDLDQAVRDAEIFRLAKHDEFRSYVEWNYAGMIANLAAAFPNAFQKPNPDAPAAPARSGSSPWLDAALSMSEGNPIVFEKFEKTNLFLALKMLDDRIKQNKAQEALYKKK